ncbi:hypothetical protein CROQUDRAFT_49961 [Cronartium quercuum f. sp. fusiforme G11]|uniref:Serine aminopeptidase S33 domain-containing protein n=1 Tax=Cronartium quercuum f. sp. fusiforme G11 TaxID=708437 RepID=A0A9P6N9X9_9BASI|nr:hypothetical protein CROQUDRAFT_49961 [Cronartium quercuum f. sp. fusiforme G11]
MGLLGRVHVWLGCMIVTYFALLAFLAIPYVQRGLLFLHWVRLPIQADFSQPEKYGLAPGQVRNLYLTTPDGARIGVWHALPDAVYERHLRNGGSGLGEPLRLDASSITDEVFEQSLRTHKTVLYAHGNAASRAKGFRTAIIRGFTRPRSLEGCRDGLNFVSYDYRGFADSSPASQFPPSESGLITDAQTVWQWLIRSGSKPSHIGLVGHSLGTAVTVGLAHRLDSSDLPGPRAVGLIAPFTSLPELLKTYVLFKVFPILQPFSFVPRFQDHIIRITLKIHFDTRARLSALSSNANITILLIHAKAKIPHSHSHTLFRALHGEDIESRDTTYQTTRLATYGTLYSSNTSLPHARPRVLYLEAHRGGHNQVGQSETSLRSLAQLICNS